MKKIFVLFAFISLLIVGCSSGDENNDFGGGNMTVYPDIVESSRQSVDGGSIVTYITMGDKSVKEVTDFILSKCKNKRENIIDCCIQWADNKTYSGSPIFLVGHLSKIVMETDASQFSFTSYLSSQGNISLTVVNNSGKYPLVKFSVENAQFSYLISISLTVFESN